jgi:hypothetical protein
MTCKRQLTANQEAAGTSVIAIVAQATSRVSALPTTGRGGPATRLEVRIPHRCAVAAAFLRSPSARERGGLVPLRPLRKTFATFAFFPCSCSFLSPSRLYPKQSIDFHAIALLPHVPHRFS